MKFLKGFLVTILAVLMGVAIFILGIVLNFKATLIDTMDVALKNELSNEIVDLVADKTDKTKEDVQKEVDKILKENESIKNILDSSYDQIIDVMNGKEVPNLDISQEVEKLIDESVDVLKEYDIVLTEKDKQEIMKIVNSAEVNSNVNSAISDLASDLSEENKTALDIYNFITGNSFKLILIGVIIVCVGLIALIKKSIYKWMIDLGISCLTVGVTIVILIPLIINELTKAVSSDGKIVISVTSLSNYGYICMMVGVIAIVGYLVIRKITAKKEIKEVEA